MIRSQILKSGIWRTWSFWLFCPSYFNYCRIPCWAHNAGDSSKMTDTKCTRQNQERKRVQQAAVKDDDFSKFEAEVSQKWRVKMWRKSDLVKSSPSRFRPPVTRRCEAAHKSTIKKVKQVVLKTSGFDLNNPLFKTLQKLPTPTQILPSLKLFCKCHQFDYPLFFIIV